MFANVRLVYACYHLAFQAGHPSCVVDYQVNKYGFLDLLFDFVDARHFVLILLIMCHYAFLTLLIWCAAVRVQPGPGLPGEMPLIFQFRFSSSPVLSPIVSWMSPSCLQLSPLCVLMSPECLRLVFSLATLALW